MLPLHTTSIPQPNHDELINRLQAAAMSNPDDLMKAYGLSVPLLILTERKESIDKIFAAMEGLILNLPNTLLKAWVLGRMLVAQPNNKKVKANLLANIDSPKKPTTTLDKACLAWAIGYAAAVSPEWYEKFKTKALSASDALAGEPAGYGLWAYIMVIRAAAIYNDSETYQLAKNSIMKLTGKKSVVESISPEFLGVSKEEFNFPSWAGAILANAAARFHDVRLHHSLKQFINESKDREEKLKKELNSIVPAEALLINKIDSDKELAQALVNAQPLYNLDKLYPSYFTMRSD